MFRLSTLTLQPVLRLVRNPCYALPFFCLFFLSAILWQQVGYLPSASCTALHSLQFPWRIQSLLQGQLGFKLVCGVISVPFALSFMYWGSVSVLDFFSFFSVISADYSFRMIDQQLHMWMEIRYIHIYSDLSVFAIRVELCLNSSAVVKL